MLTLVIMGPDQTADVAGVRTLIESIIRECGSSGRTYKSALMFAVADSAAGMNDPVCASRASSATCRM